jgi:predicted SAM-dependent methyltransferase
LALPLELARRREVHLHFGCGTIKDPRFVNIDARPMSHVHLVTKSPLLKPFADGSSDSIYSCHVLEHFSFLAQKRVLRRWLEVLKPGGRLRLSVPDFDKLVDTFLKSDRNPLAIQMPLMGGQEYPGNFHCAIFTRRHLESLLLECGFEAVTGWHPREEVDWPRDWSWSDEVSLNLEARRPLHAG